MKLSLIAIALGVTLASLVPHDFNVSITDVELKNDTLQVSIKLFTHDLEEALKQVNGAAVFLNDPKEVEKEFRAIKSYCSTRFYVSNPTGPYTLNWIGQEYDGDVTWVYVETTIDRTSSLLLIRNTLLEENKDQHNMIHFSQSGTTESKICTRDNPEVRFSIES